MSITGIGFGLETVTASLSRSTKPNQSLSVGYCPSDPTRNNSSHPSPSRSVAKPRRTERFVPALKVLSGEKSKPSKRSTWPDAITRRHVDEGELPPVTANAGASNPNGADRVHVCVKDENAITSPVPSTNRSGVPGGAAGQGRMARISGG